MQVRRPVVEAVEDVRRVDDAAAALLALLLQPQKQVLPHHHVKGNRHLVHEQHLKGAHEPKHELHAAALAVAERVHAPGRVNAEHVIELIAALRVHVLQLLHHLRHADIRLHGNAVASESHRAHAPLRVQVATLQVEARVVEAFAPEDRRRVVGVEHVAPAEHAQQRGLAGAVGADEKHALPRVQVEVDAPQHVPRLVRERQVGHLDHGLLGGVRHGGSGSARGYLRRGWARVRVRVWVRVRSLVAGSRLAWACG
mmetsp:Transcript_30545/g.97471  ORF Transcript_30545/g.97471 Transcript_30545/m.97471 type:complete len:255 (+) Transcript_30545:417-1181(+)